MEKKKTTKKKGTKMHTKVQCQMGW
jgi:hypothetical protein